MKRVLTAAVLIPLVLLLVVKGPTWTLIVAAWAVAVLAVREYLGLLGSYGLHPFRATVYIFLTLIFGYAYWESTFPGFFHPSAILGYLALVLLGFAVLLFQSMFLADLRNAFSSAVLSGFALVYVGFPLFLLVEWVMPYDVITRPDGRSLIVALLLLVWASDIFAYVTGRTVGKRLLAPRISPKKTREGAWGSMLGALLVGIGIWLYGNRSGWVEFEELHYWLLLALVVNVAAQVGDLVESMVKRGAGVKDSGAILPGHGGMLDRIDALLFAAPAMFYFPSFYFLLVNLFFG